MAKQRFYSSFSLVELMVVIAIIGTLSIISLPVYKTYVIKARIAAVLPNLSGGLDSIVQYYEDNGTFPSSDANFTLYGNSMALASAAAINNQPAIYAVYYAGNFMGSQVITEVALLCFMFSNIGTPGYVAPTGNNGTYNRICMLVARNNSGGWSKYCGNWGQGENMDMPTKYLPSGCECTRLANIPMGSACP